MTPALCQKAIPELDLRRASREEILRLGYRPIYCVRIKKLFGRKTFPAIIIKKDITVVFCDGKVCQMEKGGCLVKLPENDYLYFNPKNFREGFFVEQVADEVAEWQ